MNIAAFGTNQYRHGHSKGILPNFEAVRCHFWLFCTTLWIRPISHLFNRKIAPFHFWWPWIIHCIFFSAEIDIIRFKLNDFDSEDFHNQTIDLARFFSSTNSTTSPSGRSDTATRLGRITRFAPLHRAWEMPAVACSSVKRQSKVNPASQFRELSSSEFRRSPKWINSSSDALDGDEPNY